MQIHQFQLDFNRFNWNQLNFPVGLDRTRWQLATHYQLDNFYIIWSVVVIRLKFSKIMN